MQNGGKWWGMVELETHFSIGFTSLLSGHKTFICIIKMGLRTRQKNAARLTQWPNHRFVANLRTVV